MLSERFSVGGGAMIRSVVVIVSLVAAAYCARADDKDPIKDKLLAAKAAYDTEMKQFRQQGTDWFDKREENARKDGNKKLLDQIKAERKAFEDDGDLPKIAPAALKQKPALARKAMEAAYAEAVKAYVRAKKDDEAASVDEAFKTFLSETSLNLLSLVDPKAHTVAGECKRDGTALIVTALDKDGIFRLPYEPGEEYDFELTCRRIKGNDCICLGLVAGGRQTVAMVDAWPKSGCLTGFDLVDGKHLPENVTMAKGSLLKNDTDHTITGSVREGKIDLLVDKKLITSFKGEFTRLSLWDGYRSPTPKALFLLVSPGCSFRIDRLRVSAVKGKGTITK
jgi:hypothetical protein